jgi:hypothetical protein
LRRWTGFRQACFCAPRRGHATSRKFGWRPVGSRGMCVPEAVRPGNARSPRARLDPADCGRPMYWAGIGSGCRGHPISGFFLKYPSHLARLWTYPTDTEMKRRSS